VSCKTQDEVDAFWNKLSEGGEEGPLRLAEGQVRRFVADHPDRSARAAERSEEDRDRCSRASRGGGVGRARSTGGTVELSGVSVASHSILCLRRMSLWLRAGTKRVRQLGHERTRASTPRTVEPADLQPERTRVCPRVDARPLLVLPSHEGVRGSNPRVGFLSVTPGRGR